MSPHCFTAWWWPERPAAVAAPFERLRNLAGEWVAAEDGEMFRKGDVVARYAVTASGSAVVETVFPGSPHEMLTVYHADGPDLVLTHYCMEGNQPRMRFDAAESAPNLYTFRFSGGTNIGKSTKHVHAGTIHDPRRLEHLLERLPRQLPHADAAGGRHRDARQEPVECVGPSGSGSYASGEAGWIPCAAPPVEPAASPTRFSSASSTCPTCWFTIGCSTR